MKKVLFFIVLSFSVGIASAQDSKVPVEAAKINLDGPYVAFTESVYDFKEIYQGDKVEHVFEFKNSGNKPLIISNVQTTCGCTVPQYPKVAIAPGAKQEIKVIFNSRGKMGRQNKVITIISNAANNPERIRLTGTVLPPKSDSSDSEK